MFIKLTAVGAAAMLVSACSLFEDDCSRCKTESSVKTQRVHTMKAKTVTKQRASVGHTRFSLPGNARVGECFGRVVIPGKFRSTSERVVDRPSSFRYNTTPAVYGWETKRVLVREAGERVRVINATYRSTTERVLVAPAIYKTVVSAPRFSTRTERILVTPKRRVWSSYHGFISRGKWSKSNARIIRMSSSSKHKNGQVMCLIEIPAVYKTITRKVVVSAATTKRVMVRAAVHKVITKRVIAQPARVVREKIAAKYAAVRVRKVITAGSQRRVAIPATYRTITRRVVIRHEQFVWKKIICQGNAAAGLIGRVQGKLKAAGLYRGPINGIYNHSTARAITAYQRRNGLARGQLTYETIRHLGLQPRWRT